MVNKKNWFEKAIKINFKNNMSKVLEYKNNFTV